MQVGPADGGRRDPHDRVGWVRRPSGSGTSSTRTDRFPCHVSALTRCPCPLGPVRTPHSGGPTTRACTRPSATRVRTVGCGAVAGPSRTSPSANREAAGVPGAGDRRGAALAGDLALVQGRTEVRAGVGEGEDVVAAAQDAQRCVADPPLHRPALRQLRQGADVGELLTVPREVDEVLGVVRPRGPPVGEVSAQGAGRARCHRAGRPQQPGRAGARTATRSRGGGHGIPAGARSPCAAGRGAGPRSRPSPPGPSARRSPRSRRPGRGRARPGPGPRAAGRRRRAAGPTRTCRRGPWPARDGPGGPPGGRAAGRARPHRAAGGRRCPWRARPPGRGRSTARGRRRGSSGGAWVVLRPRSRARAVEARCFRAVPRGRRPGNR